MDIKYLRLIKTIANEGNISRSADKLYLTQSALSHQLREIEQQLGFKIFLRTRNDWKLTPEGEELYQLALKVLSEIDDSFAKIQGIREGAKGTIKVSAECYSFYHGLPSFIQKMGLLYPQIEVQLVVEATHQPVPKVIAGSLDIAIVTTLPTQADLTSIELFEDEIMAVMHRENDLASKEFLSPEDFSTEHLIIHSHPLETVAIYKHLLQREQILPRHVTAIPMTEVGLEMVQANLGIMCLPKWALEPFKLPDTIQLKPVTPSGLWRKHYLVFRKNDSDKKYIRDFINNIQEQFFLRVDEMN
ncbi:MAG: LysR family transcriptional regulator [Bacteroidota bacterium]